MKLKLAVIAILLSIGVKAQDFDKAKMDSLFLLIENNQKGMGSVSVFENGREVYRNSIGFASIEDSIEATASTKYRIGSISKMFTASVIMKLIEEGRLQPETKLEEFYPQINNSEKITIEHLLGHKSGIFNFTSAGDYTSWMEQPVSKEEIVNKIIEYGSSFPPGEQTSYSNSNYVLLSYIAEEITGREFTDLLNGYIIRPCGLDNTYLGSGIDVDEQEALSYTRLRDWNLSTETDMSIPSGAGAIVSNPTDLNIFLNCLFNEKIVSQSSLEKMKTINDGLGFGMFRVPFYDKTGYGHNGGIDGFQSSAFYFPEEKVSVAYLSNGTVMPVNDILIGVLSIFFDKDYKLPVFTEPMDIESEELDKYLGVYSSPEFPLKLTITKQDDVLIGQGTGQPSFPLEPYEENKFKFDQAMLKIEFVPEENKLILRQGGGEFMLTKE